ncbi:MAG: replicative DNA helicase [Pseudomonadales bacterium]|nr:replicative DNA helicase [Pseudomonadales bacterium]MCP5183255.1 replicative DNA helicase [Pseudomonadales bacterium]
MSEQPLPPYNDRAMNTASLKVPPHSVEAEMSVLGGLMLSAERWIDVVEICKSSDFYRPQHQLIFEAMISLADDDEPLDAVTVSEKLQSNGMLERAGGLAYLAELVDATPGVTNLLAYARIVRERSTLRQLIAAANQIAEMAFSPQGKDAGALLDIAEKSVFNISEGRLRDGGPEPVNEILAGAVKRVQELFDSKGNITGLSTGFDDLDDETAGLQKSDLIIVAGRPSMGKTSFSMNIAEHAAMTGKGAVLVFSMEMPAEQLVMRMLASLGRIDFSRLRTGNLKDEDWSRFTGAVAQLKDKQLFIDDTPALTPTEMRSRARRIARQANGGIGLIVVDYLQLMRTANEAENRVNEISEISRSLKGLAKELSCPLIALSQLNRSLEGRADKRPMMSDLRESGAIEQDADLILFIYRDEVYNDASPDKGIAEIIIGKQRNGPIGTVRLQFNGSLTKFENLAPDIYNGFS